MCIHQNFQTTAITACGGGNASCVYQLYMQAPSENHCLQHMHASQLLDQQSEMLHFIFTDFILSMCAAS
jgi:hypothetical protein